RFSAVLLFLVTEPSTTASSTLSLHDALPIYPDELASNRLTRILERLKHRVTEPDDALESVAGDIITVLNEEAVVSACLGNQGGLDRKSTRLNSSHVSISYAVFCLKKKREKDR